MNWLREHRLLLVFSALLAALVANTVVKFHSIGVVVEAQSPTLATLQLLDRIEALRTALLDAETGERGFIITGDPTYLEPYHNSVAQLRSDFLLLEQALGQDPEFRDDLAMLGPLMDAKQEELEQAIELRRHRGFAAAQRLVATDQGKLTMDAIRAAMDRIELRLNDSLVENTRRAAESTRTTQATFAVSATLTIVLFVALFWMLWQDSRQRRDSEAVLRDANDRLALSIQALEQGNRQVLLLSEMSGALQSCVNLEEAFEVTGKFGNQLFPDCGGTLYVMHASRNYLDAVASWGGRHHGAGVLGPEDCWALRRGEPYQVRMPRLELACRHVDGESAAPYLCLPLQAQGEILGLLFLEFTDGELRDAEYFNRTRQLASGCGKQIALALANIRLRETLRRQSVRDPLTGLFNRRYLEETLDREAARAERSDGTFCVVMMDVDHFKQFNDEYGHEAGDAVLREIGALLRSQTRGSDTACRYGGEEFTLILGDSTLAGAQQRCEYLRELVRNMDLRHRQQALGTITVSFGVAQYPLHGRQPEALLRVADQALYRAKREGRNRVVIADAAETGAVHDGQSDSRAAPG